MRRVCDRAVAADVAIGAQVGYRDLPVLGLPGSVWLRVASEAGLRTVSEAFADPRVHP